jgi:beta-galactosidase/beta-glucuronidase
LTQHLRLLAVLTLGCLMIQTHFATAVDWKPGAAPLMTRFARDVSPDDVHGEYPRPQMMRKLWMNLNGLWQFEPAASLVDPPAGRELTSRILVPFPMESALSGVMKHADHAWYRRSFEIPPAWNGQRVLLHFGAVDYEATVLVNGRKLGQHKGGFDAFSYDITDALKPAGAQEIIVGVTDLTADSQARGKQSPKPEGIFYTPCSGIWQTVWIEPVHESGVSDLVIEPDLDKHRLQVTVNAKVKDDSIVAVKVFDGDRNLANTTGKPGVALNLPIPNPKAWSPDNPFLYKLVVEVADGHSVVDSVESYVGMRKIEAAPIGDSKHPRILLNGKPIMQVGPLDQGFWPDGIYTAPTDEALKYDLEVTKKLGFNMLRKHVKIEPQRF